MRRIWKLFRICYTCGMIGMALLLSALGQKRT